MLKPFREALKEEVIICDGGMGTEIYKKGFYINRCFDELNVSAPDVIRTIHEDYIKAGAQLIETNTFGANSVRLAGYGLAEKTEEINRKGVQVAKEAAKGKVWVAASVGPLGKKIAPIGKLSKEAAKESFKTQIKALLSESPDLIIMETFQHLSELELAYRTVRELTDLPVVCSMSFLYYGGEKFGGVKPEEAVRVISTWPGVDVAGVNCGNGPHGVLECLERMAHATSLKLSAMPNAGLPEIVDGRMIYLVSPEYMGEHAKRMVLKGASMVGGCCGVTPAMIKEMKAFVRSVSPVKKDMEPETAIEISQPDQQKKTGIEPIPVEKRTLFGSNLGRKFQVSVELDPPPGLTPGKTLEGAKFLYEHGIDAVNIADGPRAMARMSPMSLAVLVKQTVPIETIIHYTCRDRNILGMQMDLIGANALGLRNLMLITGDPPKMGNYPDATAVFDVDSIGLIHFATLLNRGLDLAERPLQEQTGLLIGTGCNPGAPDIEIEASRYEKKVHAGAEFVFSQPVYDPELLKRFLKKTALVKSIPFFVGILPLASLKNAEFLHNEVPGMQIPHSVMERMRKAGTRDEQRAEGIKIAREALVEAKKMDRVQGAYIFPPFGRYEAVLEVLEGI